LKRVEFMVVDCPTGFEPSSEGHLICFESPLFNSARAQ